MRSDERGSGTVLVIGAMAVVLLGALAGLHLATAARSAQQSATAADLGAIAGAQAQLAGSADPCARAAAVVAANAGHLVGCQVLMDDSVQVEVEVEAGVRWAGLLRPANARARAGPAPAAEREEPP